MDNPAEITSTPSPAGSPSHSQSTPELLVQEPNSDLDIEESASKSMSRSLSPPSFNFTQPVAAAPEEAFFRNNSISIHIATQRNIRDIGLLINSRRRAAAQEAIQKGLGGSTAYIDQDDSGTYDPSTKRRRLTPPEPPTKRKRVSVPELNGDGNPRPKKNKNNSFIGYANIITFKFTTEAGLDYLRSITPDPGESSDEETECTSEDSDSGYGASFPKRRRNTRKPDRLGASTRDDGLTLEDLSYGHPQYRGCKACFLSGNDECTLIDEPTEYPCQACDDAECDCEYVNPPEYKDICARCKAFKLECSFEVDGGKDQDKCQNCTEEDVACCAGPSEERHFTSRIDDVIGRDASERQVLASRKESAPHPKERERAYVSCTQCRNEGLRCSLKRRTQKGPCKECKKADRECQFVYAPVKVPAAIRELVPGFKFKHKNRSRNVRHHSPSGKGGAPLSPESTTRQLYNEIGKKVLRTNERLGKQGLVLSKDKYIRKNRKKRLALDDSPKLMGSTLGIPHIYLKTSFCHPIKFNYIPPPTFSPVRIPSLRGSSVSTSSSRGSNSNMKDKKERFITPPEEPCDFCNNRFFGLTGLEDQPRTVEGFYYTDGSGFEEVSGGYTELGLPSTKMCVQCTTDRINIMNCSMHRIRELKKGVEVDVRIFDDVEWAKAANALREGDYVGGKLIEDAKWCSICPSAATHVCRTEQEDGVQGCGLMLCEKCDVLMEQIFRGGIKSNPEIISAHIREMGHQSYRFPPPRADATFLTPEGELMVRLQQGMGQKSSPVFSDSTVIRSEAFGGYLPRPSTSTQTPIKKKNKGKGKDWTYFHESLRPKGWDRIGGEVQDSGNGNEDDDIADMIPIPGLKSLKDRKVRSKGEIEFGGALSESARAEQDKWVAKAFGAQVIDLTGDY